MGFGLKLKHQTLHDLLFNVLIVKIAIIHIRIVLSWLFFCILHVTQNKTNAVAKPEFW